ncbi:hypothetical protein R5R73_14270 [Salinicola sp. LHM]|uniref:hypothetical protein n=1 Tax=Salinicola TaxID=404432 RepID=UPI0008DCA4D1|nr:MULTISPECIES: hypothetical protein [Salinicola]MDF3920171.1 hypothetical protein [Salinicola salarius]MEC8917447.1 hypothetical protein [Pseudomonadota bacterium]OHZ04847.1 hypothetical protein BC443_09505 [Salinicola sp. MIT1003]WQH32195.1 hypothetical protein R5R73_14270 [Salinicola sp. LHM]
MRPAMKPTSQLGRHQPGRHQLRQGATRRSLVPAEAPVDRWLNLLVSVSVVTALLVGGVALVVTLLFH